MILYFEVRLVSAYSDVTFNKDKTGFYVLIMYIILNVTA